MKLDQLTFTRFIAAIAIVIFHFGMGIKPFNLPVFNEIFKHSNFGVSYFFILSGFVMVIAYNGKKINIITYYLNRIARIYPLYLCALVIMLITYLPKDQPKVDFYAIILNATMLQAWIPKYALSLNFPGWSLSVEILFYLSFPFLFSFVHTKYNRKIISISILLIWLITQCILNYFVRIPSYANSEIAIRFLYYFPLLHINEFLIGNLTGYLFLKYRLNQKNYDLHLCVLIIIILFFLYLSTPLNYHDGIMAVTFAPFIILLSLNNGLITKLLSKKIFIILGEVSYSIYILQYPVWRVVYPFCRNNLKVEHTATWSFLIFLTTLIICSFFSYYTIEIPARSYIKNWFEKTNNFKKQKITI